MPISASRYCHCESRGARTIASNDAFWKIAMDLGGVLRRSVRVVNAQSLIGRYFTLSALKSRQEVKLNGSCKGGCRTLSFRRGEWFYPEPLTLTLSRKGRGDKGYVPISQEARYFSCSFVSRSIVTPMPASLSLAISLSMSAGTG